MSETFPALPASVSPSDHVTNERAWVYPFSLTGGLAHLRVWRFVDADGPGHLAVVTESDVGASITNAADQIVRRLADEYPGRLVVLEHYVPGDGADHDRLDQVWAFGRRTEWRAIHPTGVLHPQHNALSRWSREVLLPLLGLS